jgi:two-component system OmpR family sensor kinase
VNAAWRRLPLKARLTLWYAAVLALVLGGSAGAGYAFLAHQTRQIADEFLAETAASLADAITLERAGGTADRDAVARALHEFRVHDLAIGVYHGHGSGLQRLTYFSLKRPDGIESRVGLLPVRVGGRRLVIAVGQRLGLRARILREAREGMVIALPLALLGVTAGGFLLARQGLRPLAAMRERAERIEAATLHERLPVGSAPHDELGRLAIVFNALLERLDRAFDQQRRFMADASHELRTPVAVVRGEAEHALASARTDTELRDALDVVRDEAARMTQVVDDLFLLARADAGAQPILVEELYLDDLAAECVRAVRTLAAAKGIALVCDAEPDLQLQGDPALLRRLVLNLLDNAIKYTPACGRVTVRARRVASRLLLSVADTGRGMPAESRPQVFERFYRVPRERGEREAEGAGLGLAIVRWVARAHGGDARVASSGPGGTTIEVALPVAGVSRMAQRLGSVGL